MKTLQELYDEIQAGEELRQDFLKALESGKELEFLKDHGCEATAEEVREFLAGRKGGEISDGELDSVAGGGCGSSQERTVYVEKKPPTIL